MSTDSFDGRGNYTFGVTEQLIFPEIDYDKIDTVRGMDITIVTTAATDDQGRALLRALGFPFRRDTTRLRRAAAWQRRHSVQKQQRTPKFKVRGVHALSPVRPRAPGVPQVRAVPHLLPRDGPRRRDPRHDEGIVVTWWTGGAATADDDDRPDRRHADAHPQRQRRLPRRRPHAVVEGEGSAGRRSSCSEGYIEGFEVVDDDRAARVSSCASS